MALVHVLQGAPSIMHTPCQASFIYDWVLDSDSDFFGFFGQIPSKSIFYTIFGGPEGFIWIGNATGSILGFGFF